MISTLLLKSKAIDHHFFLKWHVAQRCFHCPQLSPTSFLDLKSPSLPLLTLSAYQPCPLSLPVFSHLLCHLQSDLAPGAHPDQPQPAWSMPISTFIPTASLSCRVPLLQAILPWVHVQQLFCVCVHVSELIFWNRSPCAQTPVLLSLLWGGSTNSITPQCPFP